MDWPFPTVRHLIVCRRPNPIDAEYREAILRIVFGLRPPATTGYPFLLPELHVFAQVTGGVGSFEFTVELYRMDADPVLIASAEPFEFTFEDRVAAYSFFRRFEFIPFDRAGLYEFRLFARQTRNGAGESVTNSMRRLLQDEPLRMEANP
jgi:hypothetical protein